LEIIFQYNKNQLVYKEHLTTTQFKKTAYESFAPSELCKQSLQNTFILNGCRGIYDVLKNMQFLDLPASHENRKSATDDEDQKRLAKHLY